MRQTKVTVGGIEYTLQHPGMRMYMDMTDNAKGKNELGETVMFQSKLYSQFFEHVIVDPKCTIDDFDDMENGFEVMDELLSHCNRFLRNPVAKPGSPKVESKE